MLRSIHWILVLAIWAPAVEAADLFNNNTAGGLPRETTAMAKGALQEYDGESEANRRLESNCLPTLNKARYLEEQMEAMNRAGRSNTAQFQTTSLERTKLVRLFGDCQRDAHLKAAGATRTATPQLPNLDPGTPPLKGGIKDTRPRTDPGALGGTVSQTPRLTGRPGNGAPVRIDPCEVRPTLRQVHATQ